MYNNLRNLPPYPTNVDEIRIAGLTAYTAVTNSALENGLRSQAESIVNTKDANDRTIVKTYSFASGAKIQDLLYYPTDPTGKVLFEIRGAYADLTGLPLQIGGAYDVGYEGRYTNARSIAYERKANQAITKAIVTNIDGTVFTDTYVYPNAASTEPDRIDQGVAEIPPIGYALTLSASAGATEAPVTLTYNFPVVHPACRLVPTIYGGVGIFSQPIIDVAANISQVSVTFIPSPTTTNTIVAFGTTNDAGLRNPGYQAYAIGVTAAGQPPSTGQSPVVITPVPDTKLRERAIRTSATLDSLRRPTTIIYYFADNSQIRDRYFYASPTDSDPTEILFDTTPSAAFPGNVAIVPSATPLTYSLNLRELAVSAYSTLDSQGRAISTIYRFASGATILDRYRYAGTADVDPTEALFDTTESAAFLNSPIALPTSPGNLGTRRREQSAGAYSTIDASGRATTTTYYYGDFTRVLDRNRYVLSSSLEPTESLQNTTAAAGFPNVQVTEVLAPLGTKFREQALRTYATLDAQGRATEVYYAFAEGTAILDRHRYAGDNDAFPVESLLDTTTVATFPGAGGGAGGGAGSSPISSKYEVILPEFAIASQANVITIEGNGSPFDTGTTITPAVTGLAGTFAPAAIAIGGASSATTSFTPTATGLATISSTNDKGLPNPAAQPLPVLAQALEWPNLIGGATSFKNRITLPAVVGVGGQATPLVSAWKEIRFLVNPDDGYDGASFYIDISDNNGDINQIVVANVYQGYAATLRLQLSGLSGLNIFNGTTGGGLANVVYQQTSGSLSTISILRSGNDAIVRKSNDNGENWTTLTTLTGVVPDSARFLKIYRSSDLDPRNGTSLSSTTVIFAPIIF